MMKKFISLLLVVFLVLGLVACGGDKPAEDKPAEQTSEEKPAEDTPAEDTPAEDAAPEGTKPYKIGVVTGTVSQGEEEFRAGENLIKKYGDMIKHVTYPDNFSQETETTISNIKSLASDPDVKAIIICQAVNGTAAAIDAVKETRDDILFFLGAPHEDPDTIAARGDIMLELDQIKRGTDIIDSAHKMGAKTFIHYSFPRHLAMQLLAARREAMVKRADELGIKFVDVEAPDPMADAGATGSQQFIMEDVPRQVEEHGVDTAFFSTNCSMQEPLIKQAVATKAIFPEQCCPSPYHAYPGALDLEIPEDKAGDVDFLVSEIKRVAEEKGMTGRLGTWIRPANVSMIYAGVEYAMEYLDGKIEKMDPEAAQRILRSVVEKEADKIELKPLRDDLPNYLLFVLANQEF